MTPAEWALLREYGSLMEAHLDLGSLELERIPTLVRGAEPGIFGPGFTGATPRGVRVYVPAPLLDFARELTAAADPLEE